MNYERPNLENGDSNLLEFKSSESIFQAAKAEKQGDAMFVHSLSPGDAARAGQGRMKLSEKQAKDYNKLFGGNPVEIGKNHWQFKKDSKRYNVRANWHVYKIEIMNYALRLKFKRYYKWIKEYVESEQPVYFVEHTKNDTQWADGNNGYGTNYLGKLLTALCWEFRMLREQQKTNKANAEQADMPKKEELDADEEEKKEVDIDWDNATEITQDIEWKIDTMSEEFLEWMKTDNIELIENGKDFYKQHEVCAWLQ